MEPPTLDLVFFILDDFQNSIHWKISYSGDGPTPLKFISLPRIHQPGQWEDAW